MPIQRATLTMIFSVSLLVSRVLCAGTLDDAPFRVVVPDNTWQLDDSTSHSMGKDVFLVATITNKNSQLKSVVTKAILKKVSASSLEELSAGIRKSFANPIVKKISDANSTFLGYPARTFVYQVTKGDEIIYNEATLFIADGKCWIIACVGPSDQKAMVKQIVTFYRKKDGK